MIKKLTVVCIVSLLLLILCTYVIYALSPYPAPITFFSLALIVVLLMRRAIKRLVGEDRLGPRLLLIAPLMVCWLPIEISHYLTRRVTEKYPTLWKTELHLTQTELINATENLSLAWKINPLNQGAAVLAARCYLEMEDYTMASKWANRALFSYPASEGAQLVVSDVTRAKQRPEKGGETVSDPTRHELKP